MLRQYKFKGRNIISILDFDAEELLHILSTAQEIKEHYENYGSLLRGKQVGVAFFEPSTRTRLSFERAAKGLGMEPFGFSSGEGTSLAKGEPMVDTLKMLRAFHADMIVMREAIEGAARYASDKLDLPIINGGDGTHEHPTQTLLDLFTIQETQGGLDNLTVAIIGDLKYGRTTHSLVMGLSLFTGNRLYLVSPESLRMPPYYKRVLESRGVPYEETDDLEGVIKEVDIAYVTRIQKERFTDPNEYEKVKSVYRVTTEMLKEVKGNLKILHPLPRDKNVLEIAYEVDETPYAYYFQQARNGLYVRMALLSLVAGAFGAEEYVQEPVDYSVLALEEVDIPIKDSQGDVIIERIKEGTVIDHIRAGKVYDVIRILGLAEHPLALATYRDSKTYGKKDIMKIPGIDLSEQLSSEELNKMALISEGTINVVREWRIVKKGRVKIPEVIEGVIKCPNTRCISRAEYKEGVTTRFHKLEEPLLLRCSYCDTLIAEDEIELI